MITPIKGIKGLWSYHREGRPIADGIAVYQYPYHWNCEVDGSWRPWLPGVGLPCEHIQAALMDEARRLLSVAQATRDYIEAKR